MNNKENEEFELSLADLFNVVKRSIWIIISSVIAMTVIGVIVTTMVLKPVYQSKATCMVQVINNSSNNSTNVSEALRIINTVGEFMVNDSVLNEVLENEDIKDKLTYKELEENLTVKYSSNSLNIIISFEHTDAQLTKIVVDQIIDSAQEISNQKNNEGNYIFPSIANTIQRVNHSQEGEYVSPNKVLYIIIFAFIGGLMGLFIGFFKDIVGNKIMSEKEIERLTDIKVIGSIPMKKKGV